MPANRSSRPARAASPPRGARPATRPVVELRLAIGRKGLGLELGGPAPLACLLVTELAASLPTARFPIDVSGGVQRFRHKRGKLERLTVELERVAAERWMAPRLRGLLGPRTPAVWIASRPWGATVGICDDALGRALAFEVAVDAHEQELRLTLFDVRGMGLPKPAVTLAMGAMDAALGRAARREGARYVVDHVFDRIGRGLLPEAGARAPETEDVRVGAITCAADAWILHASVGAVPVDTPAEAVRAREAALLTRDADEARAAGDHERARVLDLYCLERAPRHPEVCRRIADLDRVAGGRGEAARATLSDADEHGGTASGFLAGELAAESGDSSAAAAALLRAAHGERYPALAALALERVSTLVNDRHDALEWLDRAVALVPSSSRLRWSRAAMRLSLRRLRDAVADAEELEALASGAAAKHAVWRRAGALFHTAGFGAEARPLFERALRFLPDDPEATAGLGAALLAEGRIARGVTLLTRALELGEAARAPSASLSPYRLALARALAETLGDKPAAIARAREIGLADPEALAARALEGRWRADLGDFAGASLAYAQMRDLAALAGEAGEGERRPFLLEAAAFERRSRHDLEGALAHLAVAARLFPRDPEVQAAYAEAEGGTAPSTVGPRTMPPDGIPADDDEARSDDADDEARAEELLSRFRASPDDDGVVDELSGVLMRLGRSHELLAMLAGRLEDATPARRAELLPFQLDVLARLEREARDRGHDHEAQLFRDTIAQLGGALLP